MSWDRFNRFVEQTRDCDGTLLDAAVDDGLRRAKNGGQGLDVKKLWNLAGMYAAAGAVCLAMLLPPARKAIERLLPANSFITHIGAEALQGFWGDLANAVIHYIGGF